MKRTQPFNLYYLAEISSKQLGMEPVYCPHCRAMEFQVIETAESLTVPASTYEQAKKILDDHLEEKYPSSKGWKVTMIDEKRLRQWMAASVEEVENSQ